MMTKSVTKFVQSKRKKIKEEKGQRKVTWNEPVASSAQLESSPTLNSTSPSSTTSPEVPVKLLENPESKDKYIPPTLPPVPPSASPIPVQKADLKENTGLKRKHEELNDEKQIFKRSPLSTLASKVDGTEEKLHQLMEVVDKLKNRNETLSEANKSVIEKSKYQNAEIDKLKVQIDYLEKANHRIVCEKADLLKEKSKILNEAEKLKEIKSSLELRNEAIFKEVEILRNEKAELSQSNNQFKAESEIAIAQLKEKLDEEQITNELLSCENAELKIEIRRLKNNKNDDIVNVQHESTNQRGLELEVENPNLDQANLSDTKIEENQNFDFMPSNENELDSNDLPCQPLPHIPEENIGNVDFHPLNIPQPVTHPSPPPQPNCDNPKGVDSYSKLKEELREELKQFFLQKNSNSEEQMPMLTSPTSSNLPSTDSNLPSTSSNPTNEKIIGFTIPSSSSSSEDSSDHEQASSSKKYRKKRKNKKKDKKKKKKMKHPDEMKRDAMEQLRFLKEEATGRGMAIMKDDERIIKCKACRKTVSSKQYLQIHIKTVHLSVRTEPEKCSVCNKTFSNKSNLNAHMKQKH